MTILNLSDHATAYVFDELAPLQTAVFHIEGKKHQFLIDTFCGSGYLEPIKKDIAACNKPLNLINTHHHWDHVWGNCTFPDTPIIGHSLCRSYGNDSWETQFDANKIHAKGDCTKRLPTITFDQSLFFEEDGIELFSSPGHTLDSISIYDHTEQILYVGDNVALPIVFLNHPDVNLYQQTLTHYLELAPKKIVASHALFVTTEDVNTLLQYLKDLQQGVPHTFDSGFYQYVHNNNVRILS